MDLFLIIFITFFIAIIFSSLGLGGAIFYTPFFLWLGLPIFTAIPIALMLNAITAASASVTYLRHRLVETEIAFFIIPASIMGALTGSYLAPRIDTEILIILLSVVLFLASIRIIFFDTIVITAELTDKRKKMIGAGGGFLIGVTSSLVGIGGGTFIVPLLLVLGFETKSAVATSSFVVTFISLSGFLGHLGFGQQQMNISLLFYAGIAASIGAQAGSRVVFKRASPRAINRVFALILLIVVGKLLYDLIS
ncbi:putative permease [Candidatus Methanoperedens nitroreducens]|uniref:Probable membrane transporter protein n=1 Tax=Candidatus Methanoperedens nitratireducens TaxID=1392998 RepID=A0A062VCI9_9EURY|nr:sulfite exporter TauE/SafE family protein [Candidatus Methanoperedens nitroreducens]KCZ72955.1 putative permease [Candidatus Methanoperedens nitroreducens]MDJ1423101.1 sulfite exporter TauE/SafE family protein [Candidatus Methanoperedens sp.]